MIKCRICGRDAPDGLYEKHHLVPKCKDGKEMILVCVDCEDQLHQLFTIKELKNEYNSLKAILNNEKIQKWIRWIRKKPHDFNICMKRKKK